MRVFNDFNDLALSAPRSASATGWKSPRSHQQVRRSDWRRAMDPHRRGTCRTRIARWKTIAHDCLAPLIPTLIRYYRAESRKTR